MAAPSPAHPLKVLFVSTPVGPLGSGWGGGVELTLTNLAKALIAQGHQVTAIAPADSRGFNLSIIEVLGTLQPLAQSQERTVPITLPPNSVLANMWDCARQIQTQYDILINFAYDWLPFYLTPYFQRPVAHLVSMGSLTDVMDDSIRGVLDHFPGTIGMHSRAQAETFAFGDRCRILGNGFDLSRYAVCDRPGKALGWVGRIAPEKGLEDAIAAAQRAGMPLKVWGAIADEQYWQQILATYPDAPMTYEGFLPTAELQRELGQCRGLIMTPKWVEAFGNVVIEALACGVPVIAYRRGGPAELVQHGKTGWLVEPDWVEGLVAAIARLDELDRYNCRRYAEAHYSLEAMGNRVVTWLREILELEQ